MTGKERERPKRGSRRIKQQRKDRKDGRRRRENGVITEEKQNG